jgi:hypothetical protein
MTVLELIAAAKRRTVDERAIADLWARVAECERRYEGQAARRAVTSEVLARTYTL